MVSLGLNELTCYLVGGGWAGGALKAVKVTAISNFSYGKATVPRVHIRNFYDRIGSWDPTGFIEWGLVFEIRILKQSNQTIFGNGTEQFLEKGFCLENWDKKKANFFVNTNSAVSMALIFWKFHVIWWNGDMLKGDM